MDQAKSQLFQSLTMISITKGLLIHLCIENLQERLINQ